MVNAWHEKRRRCDIEGCERGHLARGLCKLHYYRVVNTGEVGPAGVRLRNTDKYLTAPERLAFYVDQTQPADACWEFEGHRNRDGYGSFFVNGERDQAHRWAWRVANGPIADGLHVRHMCDNPPCCNPNHLELGTHADNMRDRHERGHYAHGYRKEMAS